MPAISFPYVLIFVNDYSSGFTMRVEILNYSKPPWLVDDDFETLMEMADEFAADSRIDLSDYSLKAIEFGNATIIKFD